jgi:hypothetical protein
MPTIDDIFKQFEAAAPDQYSKITNNKQMKDPPKKELVKKLADNVIFTLSENGEVQVKKMYNWFEKGVRHLFGAKERYEATGFAKVLENTQKQIDEEVKQGLTPEKRARMEYVKDVMNRVGEKITSPKKGVVLPWLTIPVQRREAEKAPEDLKAFYDEELKMARKAGEGKPPILKFGDLGITEKYNKYLKANDKEKAAAEKELRAALTTQRNFRRMPQFLAIAAKPRPKPPKK